MTALGMGGNLTPVETLGLFGMTVVLMMAVGEVHGNGI